MLLKFLGGAQEVGRSAIMLRDEGSLLLDYGIKLNHKIEYPVSMPNVDAFVLSHAHLDHSGAAPTLYNEMLIPSFGTEPTLKLSELLLNDALVVARKEHSNQRFHKRQIASFMHRYTSLGYHSGAKIGNFEIELYDAGHICGSAITLIERKAAKSNKRVVYTGDYKLSPQLMHRGAEIVESDVLITESTYSTREHPDRSILVKSFVDKIKETLDSNGNVLVPVFAVGRAQEVISILYKNGLADRTYIDGMAKTATSIVLKCREFVNNPNILEKAVEESIQVSDRHDRAEALSSPSIIVTTAGMLSGGPVLDYITKLGKNSRVMLTGYQVRGSNGHNLLENGSVTVDKKPVKIAAETLYYDMSAHAGKSDLYEYVKRSNPSIVVCVHGDNENAKAMAESLRLDGYEAHAPELGETIKID